MHTADFDYDLPKELIAQHPAEPRENARLMVVNRKDKSISHWHVSDLPSFFHAGDLVVINNTKVFRARLKINHKELFLVRPQKPFWLAIGRNIKPDETITFSHDFAAHIEQKLEDGTLVVSFNQSNVVDFANTYGEVPVPPYIKILPKDTDYQTVYAKRVGSVAAPTAGFHLTKNILSQIKKRGATFAEITLHVGLGTFVPVKSETLEGHVMHSEWAEISHHAAKGISVAKRVVAVGTTAVRALEGSAGKPYRGEVNLFIKPGYTFNIVDSMLTNFHLPKSTLIVLVSTFAGRELILRAYAEAIRSGYRFYSFGDAMLII